MSFSPNHIPLAERIVHIVLSVLMITYGLAGVLTDDLYLPGKRRGVHLHGTPALLMFTAMCCAAASLLTVVVDHYDKRDNERWYRFLARLAGIAGWTFFVTALAVDLYRRAKLIT